MAKWFDCSMVFSELDLYDLRFQLLGDIVDWFVVVESGMTHSGERHAAPFGEALRAGRYADVEDKILYEYLPELAGDESWGREHNQRAQIANVLRDMAEADDWIAVTDADELLSPSAIAELKPLPAASGFVAAKFEQQFFYYDFHHRVQQGWGTGACRWRFRQEPNAIRACDFGDVKPVTFLQGGWHYSYMTSAQGVTDKIRAFMHWDWAINKPEVLDEAYIYNCMRTGVDIWGRGLPIEYIPHPDNLPLPVLQNPQKYIALGWLEPTFEIGRLL